VAASGGDVRTRQVRGRFRQPDEYGLALVLILATIVAVAVVGDKPLGQLATAALSGGTLLFILHTSQVPRRTMRIAIVVVVLALMGTTVGVVAQNGFTDGTAYAVMLGFIAIVSPIVIARRLQRHQVITLRTVAGALCLYLLFGLFFATLYGLIANLGDGAFFVQTDTPTSTTFIYFSFILLLILI
jgi:hypothetical protein